jgi:hypothetical protein
VTFVVLFLLAVVWAVYLASWLRNRGMHRNVNSISSFSKHLSVLERTSPGASLRPVGGYSGPVGRPLGAGPAMSINDVRRRRRDVLFGLAGAAVVTFGLAVVVGGPFLLLHLLIDVALVGYVVLLVRLKRLAEDRRTKVRYLQPGATMAGPVGAEVPYLVPQRAASAQ